VSLPQAKADVAATAGRIRDKDKRDRTFTIDVVSLNDSVVGNVRLPCSCCSVGVIRLADRVRQRRQSSAHAATRRQKEIAVRTALGASWPALVRQLLIESVMLGVLGGAAGLGVAGAALQIVRSINPGNIPRLEAISLDSRVLVFTFTVSILTGLLFGWRGPSCGPRRSEQRAQSRRTQNARRWRNRHLKAECSGVCSSWPRSRSPSCC
jgi:hypothetical protein